MTPHARNSGIIIAAPYMATVVPPSPVTSVPIRFLNGSSLTRYVHVDDGPFKPVADRSRRRPSTRTFVSAANANAPTTSSSSEKARIISLV